MFARLIAKAILAAAGIAMTFFGIGLLGMALQMDSLGRRRGILSCVE